MSNNTPATAKPLSSALKFWYGIGDFGFTLMTNVETFYFNAFLTNVAGFTTAMAGTIASITSIVDAALSWIYGGIINAAKPGKWGRYRTWLILLTWLVPFLFAFQFIRVSNNDVVSAIVICVAFITSHICWNLPYCANAAMVSIAGGTPEGRAQLASNRATWNNLSGVLFSYAFTGVTLLLGTKIADAGYLYAAAAFLFGVVMVAGYFVHFKVTDGYEEIEDPKAPKSAAKNATPVDMAKALIANPPLLLLVVADLAKWIVKFLVASSAVYYFAYVMGTGLLTNYMLLANLMGVVGAFAARFIAKKLSNRTAMIVAYAWMAALMILSYFLYANATVVFVLMIAAQLGYGVAYAVSPALYADTAVYARWKSGKDSTGFIMGLQNVPLKIGVLVKSVLLNTALGLAGYDAYKQAIVDKTIAAADLPATLKQGVCGAFSLWSGIFCAVGLLILVFGFKLTKEKVNQYQAEIDARG